MINLKIDDIEQLRDLKICFCIDTSKSTSGIFANSDCYLDVEKYFVDKIINNLKQTTDNLNVRHIGWNTRANISKNFHKLESTGSTFPSSIFDNGDTLRVILDSEIIFIITDGLIYPDEVTRFGQLVNSYGFHFKAVIGVIVDRRTKILPNGETKIKPPSSVNVSVLMPAMISNSCILFYNLKDIYVMWTSGIFDSIFNTLDISEKSSWLSVTKTDFSTICNVGIPVPDQQKHLELIQRGYTPFGAGNYVHLEKFINRDIDIADLMNYPLGQICQHFKVTQRYELIYNWFDIQRKKYIDFVSEKSIDSIKKQMENSVYGYYKPQDLSEYLSHRNILIACSCITDRNIPVDINIITDKSIARNLETIRKLSLTMEEDMEAIKENYDYTMFYASKSRYNSFRRNYSERQEKNINMVSDISDISDITEKSFKNILAWITLFDSVTKQIEEDDVSNSISDHLNNIVFPKYNCYLCEQESIGCILVKKSIDLDNKNDLINNPYDYFYPKLVCEKCASCLCDYPLTNTSYYMAVPLIIPVNKTLMDPYYKFFDNLLNQQIHTENNPVNKYLIVEFLEIIKSIFSCDSDITSVLDVITSIFLSYIL